MKPPSPAQPCLCLHSLFQDITCIQTILPIGLGTKACGRALGEDACHQVHALITAVTWKQPQGLKPVCESREAWKAVSDHFMLGVPEFSGSRSPSNCLSLCKSAQCLPHTWQKHWFSGAASAGRQSAELKTLVGEWQLPPWFTSCWSPLGDVLVIFLSQSAVKKLKPNSGGLGQLFKNSSLFIYFILLLRHI